MTDIIGTPVERVIPEGWSVLRAGTVSEDDVAAWDTLWRSVNSHMVGAITDVNGYATVNEGRTENTGRMRLVIRRNAPEPSVEKLRRDRDNWKALASIHEVTVGNLKSKVAELEVKVAEHAETIRWWKLHADECAARINAKDSEIAELRRERDALKAKVAELEKKAATLCRDWESQTDAIRKLKEENTALRSDRVHYKKWYHDSTEKLDAVKKAWEGA